MSGKGEAKSTQLFKAGENVVGVDDAFCCWLWLGDGGVGEGEERDDEGEDDHHSLLSDGRLAGGDGLKKGAV